MHQPHSLQPWYSHPTFVDRVITTTLTHLDEQEQKLNPTEIAPLVNSLTPALLDPSASRKSAELAAITLNRLGYQPSVCLALIESIADLVTAEHEGHEIAVIEVQRQRLQARAVDTLFRRQRAELHSALALSQHDPLTGLMNRRGFVDAMSASLFRAKRAKGHMAIAILDLDGLVRITPDLDHRDFDRLLVALARQLDSLTRSTDTIARLGGTTFALLIEGATDHAEMLTIVERELRGIQPRPSTTQHASPPAWHAGLAVYPNDGADPLELLSVAEAALRETQSTNISPGPHVGSAPLSELPASKSPTDLYSLIGNSGKHLEVRYQPIVDLNTGLIAHLEALVRLRTNTGIVGPEDFIDSLTKQERRTLFEAVLTQVAADVLRNDVSMPISINIEPDLISDEGYAASIIASWEAFGIPAHRLTIEITETQDLVSLAYGPLALLRAAGHRLALDDFGTGYASLSRIMSFPFDEIKLDRSFSEPIDLLNVGLPLITTAIDMSKLMQVDLVIEGIEDPRMIPVLQTLGASLVQGYALSRPSTMSEILALSNPLPIATTGSSKIVAAAQGFRWERAVLALAASEGSTAKLASECTIADDLVDPDLVELHLTQHKLAEQLLAENSPSTVDEFCQLGKTLRQLVSTRLTT